MNWTYDANDYEEREYVPIPEGDYRARIEEINEKVFKSGNEGFEVILAVSGYSAKVWYYLVFDPQNKKVTNQRLGEFFDCFGITHQNLQGYHMWVGKSGGVRIKHEEYNGSKNAKVAYLINSKKQADLPAWKMPGGATPNVEIPPDDKDLPFN